MPRVHHRKAGKDYTAEGIKKGEMYYYWKIWKSAPRRSKTRPRPSQLTNSPFLTAVYQAGESLADLTMKDNLRDCVDEIVSELQDLQSESEESLDMVPEQLQDTHMLTERIPELEAFINELDNFDWDETEPEEPTDCTVEEHLEWDQEHDEWESDKQGALDELQQLAYQGE